MHTQTDNNCLTIETDKEWICKGFLRVHFTIQQGGKEIMSEFSGKTEVVGKKMIY